MLRPLILAGVVALLAGCSSSVEAPFEPGVCFVYEPGENGAEGAFNKLAEGQTQLEQCAARLEEMRVRFLRLGGSRDEITGAYQGQYLFIDAEGIKTSQRLDGARFMFLARTGDGRLAVPGVITRDQTGRPVGVAAPPEAPGG